jgi:hypothetical protein
MAEAEKEGTIKLECSKRNRSFLRMAVALTEVDKVLEKYNGSLFYDKVTITPVVGTPAATVTIFLGEESAENRNP